MKKPIPAVLVFALTIPLQNIFAQDTESCTKVAKQLVELIKAADYSGVENLFNKDMSKALPLNKATQFFAGMTGQFGTIQKLDATQTQRRMDCVSGAFRARNDGYVARAGWAR